MNTYQKDYAKQLVKWTFLDGVEHFYDLATLSAIGLAAYSQFDASILNSVPNAAYALMAGGLASKILSSVNEIFGNGSLSKRKSVKKFKRKTTPFQRDMVEFKDRDGLQDLLARTAEGETREWATMFRQSYDAHNNKTTIDHFYPSHHMKIRGFVEDNSETHVMVTVPRGSEWNGISHFHPDQHTESGAENFYINVIDLNALCQGIATFDNSKLDLLSFNLENRGPVVIGYDLHRTYVPSDETNKILLPVSGHREMMRYLGTL